MNSIDLNSDLGERPGAIADGSEEQLIKLVTSANIACGVHAGDPATMEAIVRLAKKHGVGVGAHPSFPDRANFGRTEMHLPAEQLARTVFHQVRMLGIICERLEINLQHVKPHGALYNMAARDAGIARAIAKGVQQWKQEVILVGLAGSVALEIWQEAGLTVAAEAFADRRYEPDGSLRSRKHPDALITDPHEAALQAVRIARDGFVPATGGTMLALRADTICIHSDTPNALAITEEVRRALEQNGIALRKLSLLGR